MTTAVDRYILSLEDPEASADEEYSGPIIGLRTIKAAIRRRRIFCASCAVLGLLIGSAFHLVLPAKYVAITTVYLTEPSNGGAYTIADDVNLLETTAVAYQAWDALHSTDSSPLPGSYEGFALGDVLMEIKADGSTPGAAVRWSRALATAFFSVRERTLGGQTQLVISALETQEKQLDAAIQGLSNTIDGLTGSQSSSSTTTQLAVIVNERSTDQSELTTLQSTVQQDQLEENAVNQGSYVLDPAQAVPVSATKVFAEDGLSGLVAGLAIGLGIVLVGAVVSDRPRRRTDVAALLGAPVELSLQGPPKRRRLSRSRFRRSVKRPGPQLKLANSYVVRTLGQLRRPQLALVIAGDDSTSTAAAVLTGAAVLLASQGKRVVLVDIAEGRPLAKLFKARAKDGTIRTIKLGGQQIQLAVAPEDVMAMDRGEIVKDADAVLLLAQADPALGAEHLRSWVAEAVVVLRAGKVSDILIEATGQMLRDGGTPPVAAILLGADKDDETFGTVDDPGHFADRRPRANVGRHNNGASVAFGSSP